MSLAAGLRGTGTGKRSLNKHDMPNFSITFLDDRLPVSKILSAIVRSLACEFDVSCGEVDQTMEQGLAISYRVNTKAVELPHIGNGDVDERPDARCDLLPSNARPASISAERISAGLRRHHAIRVNSSGSSIREGFDRAIADIDIVNSGAHPSYGKPSAPIPYFSYDTFRNDCISLRQGARQKPRTGKSFEAEPSSKGSRRAIRSA